MQQRQNMTRTKSIQERLAEFAEETRQEAAGLPDGKERDELLKKVQRAETASEIETWRNPPELPPKLRAQIFEARRNRTRPTSFRSPSSFLSLAAIGD